VKDIPHPPYEEFRAALEPASPGHAALDDLHAAMNEPEPQPTQIAASADRLRAIPILQARIASWWDAPRTQNWLMILSDAGL
jgi:hypothetical protein